MGSGGGGLGPTHALNFKPVLLSRGQYKLLRSEPRREASPEVSTVTSYRASLNTHIRVRNGGGMMSDIRIARYWGEKLSTVQRCPQKNFKLTALRLKQGLWAKKPPAISVIYAAVRGLRSTSLKTLKICLVDNVSLPCSLIDKEMTTIKIAFK